MATKETNMMTAEKLTKLIAEVNEREEMYLPDDEHMENYIGGSEVEPVSFAEIERLYKEWGIETSFEDFFETWVVA